MKDEYYKNRLENYGMGHVRRSRILGFVEGKDLRVLDVGCGTGSLGEHIKKRGNWVGGVELSDQAGKTARERLDALWQFDIEGVWPTDLQTHDMDIVIMAEVLEHVFDPVTVLKNAREALKPSGRLIITTPNFMNWQNRLKFLFGQFEYQHEGMFDFGHIRWFTHAYLKKVLADSGFVLEQEANIIYPGRLTSLLKRWPSLFARQFVVQAKLS